MPIYVLFRLSWDARRARYAADSLQSPDGSIAYPTVNSNGDKRLDAPDWKTLLSILEDAQEYANRIKMMVHQILLTIGGRPLKSPCAEQAAPSMVKEQSADRWTLHNPLLELHPLKCQRAAQDIS